MCLLPTSIALSYLTNLAHRCGHGATRLGGPYRLLVLVAVIPYILAYLSYRGAVVAASLYGSALDSLINLDRFALYEQLRLQLPTDTGDERETNEELARLFNYDDAVVLDYRHPDAAGGG